MKETRRSFTVTLMDPTYEPDSIDVKFEFNRFQAEWVNAEEAKWTDVGDAGKHDLDFAFVRFGEVLVLVPLVVSVSTTRGMVFSFAKRSIRIPEAVVRKLAP